jgi:hypothetical protein
VRLLIVISVLSRREDPTRGGVLGTVPIEHVSSLVCGLCGTDERAESLEHVFHRLLLRALYRIQLGLLARLDYGRKREQCCDVPFAPLPRDFVHTPFGVVLARVQGAMQAMGVPFAIIDGLPPADDRSPVFLHDVANPPGPRQRAAITTRNERIVSTAAPNQRKYWTSGMQLADDVPDEADSPLSRCSPLHAWGPSPARAYSKWPACATGDCASCLSSRLAGDASVQTYESGMKCWASDMRIAGSVRGVTAICDPPLLALPYVRRPIPCLGRDRRAYADNNECTLASLRGIPAIASL